MRPHHAPVLVLLLLPMLCTNSVMAAEQPPVPQPVIEDKSDNKSENQVEEKAASAAEGKNKTDGAEAETNTNAEASESEEPSESEYTVRPGPLSVSIDAEGAIEATRVQQLKLDLEYWPGSLDVLEIVPTDQHVEIGSVIARFGNDKMTRWIRQGQEALEQAQFRLGIAKEEFAAFQKAKELRLARDKQDFAKMENDWNHFLTYVIEQRTRKMNNDLQRAENSLEVAETEFTQLDKMYKESRIADDTKDIVLERSKRSLVTQRESAALARRDHQQYLERELPNDKLEWQRNVERKTQDLALSHAAMELSERQKVDELVKLERAVRDAQETLEGYESDYKKLTLTAPFSGIVRHGGLEVGDSAGAKNAPFAELHSAMPYQVKLHLLPKEALHFRVGDQVRVLIPDLQNGDLSGEITSIANVARADSQGSHRFAVKIRLEADPRLRIGLKAKLIHSHVIPEALAIPKRYISVVKGAPTCEVRTAEGKIERRTVTLGMSNDDSVHVLNGLHADDVIIRPAKKKTTS